MWAMLNKYRYAVYFAPFLSLIACAWGSGYLSAKRHYVAQISSLHHEYTQKQLAAEQQARQQLQAALVEQQKWQDFAQKQGAELAHITQQLDKQAAQHQKEITHAIEQDKHAGDCIAGLGASSLHLYNRAFGYTD